MLLLGYLRFQGFSKLLGPLMQGLLGRLAVHMHVEGPTIHRLLITSRCIQKKPAFQLRKLVLTFLFDEDGFFLGVRYCVIRLNQVDDVVL